MNFTEQQKLIQMKMEDRPFKIQLKDKVPFTPSTSTQFKPAAEVAEELSYALSIAYQDFVGCHIGVVPVPNGAAVEVKIYFNPAELNKKGKGIAVLPIENTINKSNSILQNVNQLTNLSRNSSRLFELTENGLSGLLDILDDGAIDKAAKDKNFKLINQVEETKMNLGRRDTRILACVSAISFDKVLDYLYPTTNKDGQHVYGYRVSNFIPLPTVANGGTNPNSSFLLGIERVDLRSTNQIAKQFGQQQYDSNIAMVKRMEIANN